SIYLCFKRNGRLLGITELFEYLHLKYGDIFEIWFSSERTIVLSHPKYMVKMHQASTKSKYTKRFSNGHGKEYGLVDNGVFNNSDIH
ncbi:6575_t:CDS:1, partial [Scutellospora calospora]